ncbi:MAG: AMP-binding protein [Actinomycetota bacterium]|nr:AMP-binding protein [Actinomycetota bacterium]
MSTGEQDLYALRWPPGPGAVAALERLWSGGVAVLPLRWDLPDAEVGRLLDLARPAALIDPDGTTPLEGAAPTGAGVASCLPTAGSTGPPKLVELSHRALETSARLSLDRLDAGAARWLCCLPLDHVAGLMTVMRSRAAGTGPVVLPRFDVDAVAHAEADAISLVPAMLERLLAHGADLARWRWILLGGAAIAPSLLDRACAAGARVVRTYGMTETCGGVVYDGVPLDGVEIDLGEEGMIRLRTPTIMDGYRFGAPALDDGWFVTGDLGEWVDGRLRVIGRADEVIVTGGEKVSPDEVEALLASHPRVAEVAVAGRDDREWGQRVVAFVVPATGEVPTLEELRVHVKERAAAYKAPREVVVVPELPRLPSGKVARASLSSVS